MTTLLIRYHVADNYVQTVVHAVETAFGSLKEDGPQGLRFTYYRVMNTNEFVGIVELDDGIENPLPKLEATRALKAAIDTVAREGTPTAKPLQLLGSYSR